MADSIPNVEVSNFKIEEFKIQKIQFPDKDGNIKVGNTLKKFTGNQVISYVNYIYPNAKTSNPTGCYFLTDFIKLTYGGVPGDKNKDGQPIPEDQRKFVKVPLDPEQKTAMQLKKVISALDDYVEHEKEHIFGSTYNNNYVDYQQLLKAPKPKDPNESINFETAKCFCKFKFDQNSIPIVYIVKERNDDGDVIRVSRVKCDNITDFAKYVKYGNTVKFLCHVSKLWCDHPNNSYDIKGKKTIYKGKYGLTIKVKQVLVEERQSSTTSKDALRNDFLLGGNVSVDNDDNTNSSAAATNNNHDNHENDDDDNDSD
jgi:hypothetical protein